MGARPKVFRIRIFKIRRRPGLGLAAFTLAAFTDSFSGSFLVHPKPLVVFQLPMLRQSFVNCQKRKRTCSLRDDRLNFQCCGAFQVMIIAFQQYKTEALFVNEAAQRGLNATVQAPRERAGPAGPCLAVSSPVNGLKDVVRTGDKAVGAVGATASERLALQKRAASASKCKPHAPQKQACATENGQSVFTVTTNCSLEIQTSKLFPLFFIFLLFPLFLFFLLRLLSRSACSRSRAHHRCRLYRGAYQRA